MNAIAPKDDLTRIHRSQFGILFKVADRAKSGRVSWDDFYIFETILKRPDAEYWIAFQYFDVYVPLCQTTSAALMVSLLIMRIRSLFCFLLLLRLWCWVVKRWLWQHLGRGVPECVLAEPRAWQYPVQLRQRLAQALPRETRWHARPRLYVLLPFDDWFNIQTNYYEFQSRLTPPHPLALYRQRVHATHEGSAGRATPAGVQVPRHQPRRIHITGPVQAYYSSRSFLPIPVVRFMSIDLSVTQEVGVGVGSDIPLCGLIHSWLLL